MPNRKPPRTRNPFDELENQMAKSEKVRKNNKKNKEHVTPAKAVTKLYKAIGKRAKAKTAIYDALVSGMLSTRGYERWSEDGFGGVSAERCPIMQEYWSDLPKSALASWDWDTGEFANPNRVEGRHAGYSGVDFKIKDVNAILKRLEPRQLRAPTNRVRDERWGAWLAAAATLAVEGRITRRMTQAKLYDEIATKIGSWNVESMTPSSVSPAAGAFLRYFAEHPPAPPGDAGKLPNNP